MAQVITANNGQPSTYKDNLVIPFINASFATDIKVYLILWPLLWVGGIDQFLLPFFLIWETMRYLLRTRGRFTINSTICWAFLLAMWWLVPVIWVEREYMDIFLKQAATIWSQVLALLLFWNCLRTEKEWYQVVRGLEILALYIALGGLLFILGLWRGELLSLMGRVLPVKSVESSAFFSSVSLRTFGSIVSKIEFLPVRVKSFSLSFSSLSMITLITIPLLMWRYKTTRGLVHYGKGIILVSLLLCLIYSQSRVAYVAFAIGAVLFLSLRFDLFKRSNRFERILLIGLVFLLVVAILYIFFNEITMIFSKVFIEWRRGSWLTRQRIYQETIRLLPEHFIAGWGVLVRIPGVASSFSAGSHSSYLGIIFQHGIVGLILYLCLWISIWRRIIKGLRKGAAISRSYYLFWISSAVAMLALNIREAADSWWWDQLLTFTVWIMWGLIITRSKVTQCVIQDAVA
jgi:O-antigen ligase